jgi:hypothetical protein
MGGYMLPENHDSPLRTPEELDADAHEKLVEQYEQEQKQSRILAGEHYAEYDIETVTDGKYCPKITVSTNNKTSFITLQFTPIIGATFNILMTKAEFKTFAKSMIAFLNSFASEQGATKPLIKD